MHQIFFSIITINLNNKPGLLRTIESVVSQTYTDFEYIVIDGASKDGSQEVIQQYADQIDYWVSEPDNGIYQAMNKGIKVAKGDFLLFLNSGDYLFANFTLDEVKKLINPSSSFASGNLFFSSSKGKVIRNVPETLSFDFLVSSFLPHSSTFILRKMFDKYGLYKEEYKIVSDWAFFLEALIDGTESYQKINCVVSIFDTSGISGNKKMSAIHSFERKKVLNDIFPPFVVEHIIWLTYPRNLLGTPRLKMLKAIENKYLLRGLLHALMKILFFFSKK